MQIDYPRNLVAQFDGLNIRGVPAGSWTFAATGFINSDVSIFDVTDPAQVRRVMVSGSPNVLDPTDPQQGTYPSRPVFLYTGPPTSRSNWPI